MKTVVLIGGGAYAPRLFALLAARLDAPIRVVLHGRDPARLEVVRAAAAQRAPGTTFDATTDLDRALDGADVVIAMARIGGLAARAHDERFPTDYGLAGDEGLGPGGVANTWRTLPWMRQLGAAVRARCPRAWVLNLMAPLGTTTRALEEAGARAVGLCELPETTRRDLGHGPGEGRYGGLNHLGWFWDLPGRLGVFGSKYEARLFGEAATPSRRAAALAALDARLMRAHEQAPLSASALELERPTPWFDLALVPALCALLVPDHPPADLFLTARNAGHLVELSPDVAVELEGRLSPVGLRRRAPGPLPPQVVTRAQALAEVDRLAYAAALERDPDGVLAAMRALPFDLTAATCLALAQHALTSVGDTP